MKESLIATGNMLDINKIMEITLLVASHCRMISRYHAHVP